MQTNVQQLGVHQLLKSQIEATHPVPHRIGSPMHRTRGSGMSPVSRLSHPGMEVGSVRYPQAPRNFWDQELNGGLLPRGRTRRRTGELSEPSSPTAAGSLPTLWCPRPQCLSRSRFPQGPAARPAHCAKTPPWPGSTDLRPAAAPGGQGSEPIPGISSLTRRHCRNYPAIPFKCTATIATDRCSVPATVHSKAGAKHKT